MANIAFIGLGNMGGPMAANLVKAGHKVIAFDLVEASKSQAKSDGATIAESAAAAVVRLHVAEQLQRMLGLEPVRGVRRDLALEPTSRCCQVLVLHQVAKPAATAAAAARHAHLPVMLVGPDISLLEIVCRPFRAGVI